MDSERPLGVIEALAAVRDQCPHEPVRRHAARALDAVRERGAEALPEQVSLVLSTIAGWRGERAQAVKAALHGFLASRPPGGAPPPRGGSR